MICNQCGKPMVQYKKKGGGIMSPAHYSTWEIKVCEECDIYVLEDYTATRIEKERIDFMVYMRGQEDVEPEMPEVNGDLFEDWKKHG